MKPLTPLVSRILSSFRKKNQRRLRKLNDEVLRLAVLDFSPASFNLAVYSYILSKVVSKPRYLRDEYKSCMQNIEQALGGLASRMDNASEEELEELFTALEHSIACLEERDPRFVVDLITKGKLKMAATMYAQGISLGIAAETTGLDKQEILDYAGETMMFDRLKDEVGVHERMKAARKLLSA
ncbi:MAG: hypothetical protein AB1324_01305 [Candidatus Micrarchaeota archaeon]